MTSKRTFFFIGVVVIIFTFFMFSIQGIKDKKSVENSQRWFVNAEDFGAKGDDLTDDSKALQDAINYSQREKIGKVILSGNKIFTLKKGINLKEGIELVLGQNTKLQIEGNFRVFNVEKNASLKNGIIEITDENFDSEVIYLDGIQKFWSWERTEINNVSIINSTGTHKGVGLSLYAGKSSEFISFVHFEDLNIVGLHTGIKLKAEEPSDGTKYSFINGNRFSNLTLDDCVRYIEMDSSISIPNEVSGNIFSGLQIQLSSITENVLTVTGSDNTFQGMIWDAHILKENIDIIHFKTESMRNSLNFNLESKYINDDGKDNFYFSPQEAARRNN
jgi:Pectate lyase superfamily protein